MKILTTRYLVPWHCGKHFYPSCHYLYLYHFSSYMWLFHILVCSLYCYSCLSTDEKNCKLTQKKYKCQGKEDMCITIRFSYVDDKSLTKSVQESGFQKTCAIKRFGCNNYCRTLLMTGYNVCKVTLFFIWYVLQRNHSKRNHFNI